jgi:hypothetical protein
MTKRFQLRGTDFNFSADGGPIDEHAEHLDLFGAIGFAVSAWARMETMLTALVMHVNKDEASNALYEANPQNAFTRKLTVLENWLTKHPPHARLRAKGDTNLFAKLRGLAERRNLIAHGLVESYDRARDLVTIKQVTRVGRDEWQLRTYETPVADIRIVGQLANTANRYFISLADDLFGRPEDAQSQTP